MFQITFSELPLSLLSLAQPDFKHKNKLFTNTILLHRILVEGLGAEEILNMTQKFSKVILSRECQYTEGHEKRTKVGALLSPLYVFNFPL